VRNVEGLVIGTVGVVWMLIPLVLTAAAWWKWGKAERPRDFPFVIGVSLATLACFEIIPFWIPVTTRWEQLRVDVISYGALVAGVCTLVALLVLPFATLKAKWLAFTSSAMTLLFVAMFLLSLSV
jgi:hypothetical protein